MAQLDSGFIFEEKKEKLPHHFVGLLLADLGLLEALDEAVLFKGLLAPLAHIVENDWRLPDDDGAELGDRLKKR